MLNIISFLLILIITLFRMKSGYSTNPLLNAGMLILTGYFFSLFMRYYRLPVIFGYILAGVIAGEKGLGLVQEHFVEQMFFIENIFMMILLSVAAQNMFHRQTLAGLAKNFSSGAVLSFAAFALTTGIMLPLAIPVTSKIVFGLFASIFSPLIMYFHMDNEKPVSESLLQIAFGGFVVSVILWGITTALAAPQRPDQIKLAFMPVFIGLSSTVAGFIWAYVAEKLIYNPSKDARSLYPLIIMLLIYPLIKVFGFDFLFLAVGIGIYNGLISERESCFIENSQIPLLVVFLLFGTKLSLEGMYFLGKSGWILSLVIAIIILFARISTFLFANRFISSKRVKLWEIYLFIPFGPLSIILLRRFLPGFRHIFNGEMNIDIIYSICTMFILITAMISLCLNIILRLFKKISFSMDDIS